MEGCGWDVAKVRNLLRFSPEVLTLFEEAIAGRQGGDRRSGEAIKGRITTLDKNRGLPYTLRRLKKISKDLHARVLAGEISANKAAQEAGFRKIATPLSIIDRQLQKLSAEEQLDLARKILDDFGVSHD
jgi:hypothetical protein